MHPNTRITNRANGVHLIANTDTVTGDFSAVVSLDAATKFHTLTGNQTGVADTTSGTAYAFPVGTEIEGSFSAIKLHAGAVLAYLK
jgi:hypothetical protein